MKNNTIFDDVFRTMVERMPQLVIPLINEVFGTDYTEDEEIIPIHNEHQTKSGEVISDSCLMIRKRLYHIECQSQPDAVMAVRMIEYDFAIALEHAVERNGMYEMKLPKSCTLYLRHTRNTPDELTVKVYLEHARENDREYFYYKTPIIKVQNYTKDEIFQKKLLLFLPFYIMRYEKQLSEISKDIGKIEKLLSEYEDIRYCLEQQCCEKKKAALYADMIELIIKISDYILKAEENLKERIGGVMGGQVLKLRSEELIEQGMQSGKAEGIRLMKQVLSMQKQGKTLEEISQETGISLEEVGQMLEE